MIRSFAKKDFNELLKLGKLMHAESTYRDLDFSVEKLLDLGNACINSPKEYLGLVHETSAGIDGMFIGYICPYFFGNDKIAQDLILYVTEKARGGAAAVKLIKSYEDWARLGGASQIMLGVSTGIEEERTVGLYEKLGFHKSGTILKK